MKTIRYLLSAIALLAAAALGTACSDVAAPRIVESAGPSPGLSTTSLSDDTIRVEWRYMPRDGGELLVGHHRVEFPPLSICDPATSGYGPTMWDAKCTPAPRPIRISAKSWTAPDGHPHAEFSPALRFVPSKAKGRWVTMRFRDRAASDAVIGSLLNIVYSPGNGLPTVDESLTDRTQRTHVNAASGTVHRRIKHFSGYEVTAGYTPTDDTQATP